MLDFSSSVQTTLDAAADCCCRRWLEYSKSTWCNTRLQLYLSLSPRQPDICLSVPYSFPVISHLLLSVWCAACYKFNLFFCCWAFGAGERWQGVKAIYLTEQYWNQCLQSCAQFGMRAHTFLPIHTNTFTHAFKYIDVQIHMHPHVHMHTNMHTCYLTKCIYEHSHNAKMHTLARNIYKHKTQIYTESQVKIYMHVWPSRILTRAYVYLHTHTYELTDLQTHVYKLTQT